MFRGSIPAELRSLVLETVASWGVDEVWVGCSGNFTIERVLSSLPTIHGNDVQLYSCAIGSYLAGVPLTIGIADEHEEEWGWLAPSLATPEGAVATIMLSTRMLSGLGRTNGYLDEEPKHKGWVPVASVVGTYNVPASVAILLTKAISRMVDAGEVSDKARWQALEYWAAESLSS
jgi:hypothetical protein